MRRHSACLHFCVSKRWHEPWKEDITAYLDGGAGHSYTEQATAAFPPQDPLLTGMAE